MLPGTFARVGVLIGLFGDSVQAVGAKKGKKNIRHFGLTFTSDRHPKGAAERGVRAHTDDCDDESSIGDRSCNHALS